MLEAFNLIGLGGRPSRLLGLPAVKSTNGVTGIYAKGLAVTAAGTLCAIGFSSLAGRSTDGGKTWSSVSVPASGGSSGWNGLSYGNGRLVAVNNNYTAACYSANDGASYALSTLPGGTYNWYDTSYDDAHGRFIAVGGAPGTRTAYSTDGGVNWSLGGAQPSSLGWGCVCAAAGRALAAGWSTSTNHTTAYATSDDGGGTWVARAFPLALSVMETKAIGGRFCVLGYDASGAGHLLISDSGIGGWSDHPLPASYGGFDFGEGLWVFVGLGAGVPVATTTDLKQFNLLNAGSGSDTAQDFIFARGRFVALPPYNGTTTNVFSLG